MPAASAASTVGPESPAALSLFPANTFRSTDPRQRIDCIWVSPDLTVVEVSVPATTASDHLPVMAVIDR